MSTNTECRGTRPQSQDTGAANTVTAATRRQFLGAASSAAIGTALAGAGSLFAHNGSDDRAVILILCTGGPSQFETWDPKPDAPSEIRGPFRSIATAVPGIRITEHLPRIALRMGRIALLRSLHHDALPIHETGHQLLQTGRLSCGGREYPHAGAVVSRLLGAKTQTDPFVILPAPAGNLGMGVSRGQTAGMLGPRFAPRVPRAQIADGSAYDLRSEPLQIRESYGNTPFGRDCLTARRLIEAGSRFVTINMFETVFNRVSWDCHGTPPFSTLNDYARELLPTFDRAFSGLLDDLAQRGRLDSTLVVATGEFGRTPHLNASGGRDHWPSVWSAVVAGGGVAGGQIIGASDAHGAHPADRPITPQELLATMYRSLGLNPSATIELSESELHPIAAGQPPIEELFA